MDRKTMKAIYALPEDKRASVLSGLTDAEREEYTRYADMQAFSAKTQSGGCGWKRWLISALIYAAVIIIMVVSAQKKADKEIAQIFHDHACIHGICVDNQWFATADDLSAYMKKYHANFNFYVVYAEYSYDQIEYKYHENGL